MNPNPPQFELAVILIATKWDRHLVDATGLNFSKGMNGIPYLPIIINGDNFPDITSCLNLGIAQAIASGAKYVTWAHTDMDWQDPHWFPTLRNILDIYPEVFKICASNSRDQIHPWRIGQEQSWLMRTMDFQKNSWLWFDSRFRKCGGCEDYLQHFNILARGHLIAITPDTTIFHKGAQTRSKYDSNPDQLYNQGLFGLMTEFGQLVEVHQAGYFGVLCADREEAFESLHFGLRGMLFKEQRLPDPLVVYPEAKRMQLLKQLDSINQ